MNVAQRLRSYIHHNGPAEPLFQARIQNVFGNLILKQRKNFDEITTAVSFFDNARQDMCAKLHGRIFNQQTDNSLAASHHRP